MYAQVGTASATRMTTMQLTRPLHIKHYGNVFVHNGGKQENRQFVAKMHQIAPNCASSFKNFPGVTPPDPHTGEGDTPPHTPPPLGASRLDSWPPATRSSPLRVSYSPPETNVWIKPWLKCVCGAGFAAGPTAWESLRHSIRPWINGRP